MKTHIFTVGALLASLPLLLSLTNRDCKGVTCKTEFVREGVVVLDADGEYFDLDDAYTYNRTTNAKIRFKDFKFGDMYVLMDDSYHEKLQDKTTRYQFIGVRNGRVVINEPYVFSGDCCHIKKESGKDTIVVDTRRIRR
jgi:hypothetical protein